MPKRIFISSFYILITHSQFIGLSFPHSSNAISLIFFPLNRTFPPNYFKFVHSKSRLNSENTTAEFQ